MQVVLRRAKHALGKAWNPFSAKESCKAAAVLGDLLAYLPPDSPALQVAFPSIQSLLPACWISQEVHKLAQGSCRAGRPP